VVMTDTEVIDLADLPAQVRSRDSESEVSAVEWREGLTLQAVLDRVEKSLLSSARERFRNQSEVATALGVNQSTIARKFRKHGLQ